MGRLGLGLVEIAIQPDPIIGVFLHHDPLEKRVEEVQHALGPEDTHVAYLEMVSHWPDSVLQEVVDVIAEQIDRAVCYDIPVSLLIYHELHQQHQYAVDLLEVRPADSRAQLMKKLREDASDMQRKW